MKANRTAIRIEPNGAPLYCEALPGERGDYGYTSKAENALKMTKAQAEKFCEYQRAIGRDSKIVMHEAPRQPDRLYYIEVTDVFGGEANYSWVTRHIIRASTERGAVNKFSRLSCMEWHGVGCERFDSKSGATCYFLNSYDHDTHSRYLHFATDERTELEKAGIELFQDVHDALEKRWKGAGSPAHGTEMALWDMERVLRKLPFNRTVKEIFADGLELLGEWLDCADTATVTDNERGIFTAGKKSLADMD
jgi:hypothetical protein